MMVQDDQIRFQSEWCGGERLHAARARRSADVGCKDLAARSLGTSYEWGSVSRGGAAFGSLSHLALTYPA